MSTLLVVTGPPGSGKSTVARLVAGRFERSVLVDGDAFFRFVERGAILPWLPAANEQNEVVTQAAAAAAGTYAAGGFTTVFDGVVGPWFLSTFLRASGRDQLDYAVLLPSIELCVERVATREYHGFRDEAATRHMHRQFADAHIEDRHLFVDQVDSPELSADAVSASLEHGLLGYPDPQG